VKSRRGETVKKLIAVLVLCAISVSCAPVIIKPPSYRSLGTVAGVEVRIYQTRRDFLAALPKHVAAFAETIERLAPGTGAHGFFDPDTKIIHVIDNAALLVHEIKHHLEDPWVHGLTPSPEDQGWRQVGKDKVFTLRGVDFPVHENETAESVIIRLKKIFN